MPNCFTCGKEIESFEMNIWAGYQTCMNCYYRKIAERTEHSEVCTKCYTRIRPSQANKKLGYTLCEKCYEKEMEEKKAHECVKCKKYIRDLSNARKMPDGRIMCLDCYRKEGGGKLGLKVCTKCKHETDTRYVNEIGEIYCPKCAVHVAEALQKVVHEPVVVVEKESPVIRRLRRVLEKLLRD